MSADDRATLWSVSISGIVTLALEHEVPVDERIQIAAIENLLDIVRAAGGPAGFVRHYGSLGVEVEYVGETFI